MIYSDLDLSRKLEGTEAKVNVDFIDTRARIDPASGAAWIEVGGAFAMYDGVQSPLTQTFGLGIFEGTTTAHLDTIETFFIDRGAPVFHEVSPIADASTLNLLGERGYRPVELTNVMYRELAGGNIYPKPRTSTLTTRVIGNDEVELWARTSADGWATENDGLADFMYNFASVSAQCDGSFPCLAEIDGHAVATGMLFIYDDVCMLAGASTIPDARNQGAQTALLEDRLSFAASQGCSLAIMGATPGSQSQRNAQKNGFNIAYTRTKWMN